jgi:hypothetical protein
MMKLEKLAALFFAAVIVLGFAASAGAVDGTIEINQAKVLAAGGFPYTVSKPGSYRLTGNLTIPGSTDGIDVTADGATIDLNGFSVTSITGSGVGVNASGGGDITVENGQVTGFSDGVDSGPWGIVRKVHAEANSHYGINAGNYSVVEGCTANFSTPPTAVGIACFNGCQISTNTVNQNGADGIDCTGIGCVISGNTVTQNGKTGIRCNQTGCVISGNAISFNALGISANDTTTGYGGNVLSNNTSGNVLSGTSMKNNVCSGVVF